MTESNDNPGPLPLAAIPPVPEGPGSAPAAMLAYRGPSSFASPARITMTRDGDALTLIVPAASFASQIVVRVVMLLLAAGFGMFAAACALLSVSQTHDGAIAVFWLAVIALLAAATFRAVCRLIHTARHGRDPYVLRVSPAAVEFRGPGKLSLKQFSMPTSQILDVRIHPGMSGRFPAMIVQIISKDDHMERVAIPWRTSRPMIEVEDNLRDVLKLEAAKESK